MARIVNRWSRVARCTVCPNLVASLRKNSEETLDEAIRAASWRMEYLTLLEQARNPKLHRVQAEELHRTELWRTPEPSAMWTPLAPPVPPVW